jgi:hypothetical protein
MDRPTIGRIIRYVLINGEIRPGIITRVIDMERGTIGMHLFLDPSDPDVQVIDEQTGEAGVVRYAEGGLEDYPRGTWHWPPRT